MQKIEIHGRNYTPDLFKKNITQEEALDKMGRVGGNVRESIIHFLLSINAFVSRVGIRKEGWDVRIRCETINDRLEKELSLRKKFDQAIKLGVIDIKSSAS